MRNYVGFGEIYYEIINFMTEYYIISLRIMGKRYYNYNYMQKLKIVYLLDIYNKIQLGFNASP